LCNEVGAANTSARPSSAGEIKVRTIAPRREQAVGPRSVQACAIILV
jgi:hypothetical protein